MQAGQIGVGAPRVSQPRPEVTITGTEFRNMQQVAADYQLEHGPTSPDRMSLEEAFAALAAGQLDLEDMNGSIRYASPTEAGHAIAKQGDLRHYTLLALDDGIHPAVVFTIGDRRALSGGEVVEEEEHASHRYAEEQFAQGGGEIHVDMPRRQPEVIFHDGPPPAGYEQGFPQGEPYPVEPSMQRGRDVGDQEPPPMARGRRGEPMMERHEPHLDREPQRAPEMGFDERDRIELRARPEDGPVARRVDGRGARKPAEEPAGEDKPMKIGRVTLNAADHKELHAIAHETGVPVDILYRSLRAPTNDERLYLRGQQPMIREPKTGWFGNLFQKPTERLLQRDAEAQERLLTIDPKDTCPPIIVSLAQKPSYVNLISGALHFLSAAPGLGGVIQGVGGFLLATAGAIASFLPFVKREHNVDMVRAGLKHMALGAIAAPTDYATGGASWYLRAPLALAMSVQDFAQFFRSRKATEATFVEVKGKPSAFTRATGILDTVGSGAMAALGR